MIRWYVSVSIEQQSKMQGSESKTSSQHREANLFARGWLELFRHLDQFGERTRAHFSHHLPALRLHGDLAGAEIRCDLLVQHARGHHRHDLALAGSQRLVTAAQIRKLFLPLTCDAIQLERLPDRVEQLLVAETLHEELDRPRPDGLQRHGDVATTAHA